MRFKFTLKCLSVVLMCLFGISANAETLFEGVPKSTTDPSLEGWKYSPFTVATTSNVVSFRKASTVGTDVWLYSSKITLTSKSKITFSMKVGAAAPASGFDFNCKVYLCSNQNETIAETFKGVKKDGNAVSEFDSFNRSFIDDRNCYTLTPGYGTSLEYEVEASAGEYYIAIYASAYAKYLGFGELTASYEEIPGGGDTGGDSGDVTLGEKVDVFGPYPVLSTYNNGDGFTTYQTNFESNGTISIAQTTNKNSQHFGIDAGAFPHRFASVGAGADRFMFSPEITLDAKGVISVTLDGFTDGSSDFRIYACKERNMEIGSMTKLEGTFVSDGAMTAPTGKSKFTSPILEAGTYYLAIVTNTQTGKFLSFVNLKASKQEAASEEEEDVELGNKEKVAGPYPVLSTYNNGDGFTTYQTNFESNGTISIAQTTNKNSQHFGIDAGAFPHRFASVGAGADRFMFSPEITLDAKGVISVTLDGFTDGSSDFRIYACKERNMEIGSMTKLEGTFVSDGAMTAPTGKSEFTSPILEAGTYYLAIVTNTQTGKFLSFVNLEIFKQEAASDKPADVYSIAGSFNEWNIENDLFEDKGEGIYEYTLTAENAIDFKIVKNKSWDTSLTTETSITEAGKDYTLVDGNGKGNIFTFNYYFAKDAVITLNTNENTVSVSALTPAKWYVMGANNTSWTADWDNGIAFDDAETEGRFSTGEIPVLSFPENKMKIRKGSDWSFKAFGGKDNDELTVAKITGNTEVNTWCGENSADILVAAGTYVFGAKISLYPGTFGDANFKVSGNAVTITGLNVEEEEVSLETEATSEIKADFVNGEDAVTVPEGFITYVSDKEEVATVKDGVITAVAEGTATITVSGLGFTKTITVKVAAPKAPETIEFGFEVEDGEYAEALGVGDEGRISVKVTPEDAIYTVTWTVEDETIIKGAAVAGNQLKFDFEALKAGKTTVTASVSEELSISCTVYVQGDFTITLDKNEAQLEVGETLQLVATIAPEVGDDAVIEWTSSDEEVATVAEDGTVTAVAAGTAIITASYEGATAKCLVTVVGKPNIYAIALDKEEVKMEEGEKFMLSATVSPEDLEDYTLEWTSSDENVATVAEDGTVTAVAAGTATITVSLYVDDTDEAVAEAECKVIVSTSGIAAILADGETADVYNFAGICIVRNADRNDLRALAPGLYIINGVKYVVR